MYMYRSRSGVLMRGTQRAHLGGRKVQHWVKRQLEPVAATGLRSQPAREQKGLGPAAVERAGGDGVEVGGADGTVGYPGHRGVVEPLKSKPARPRRCRRCGLGGGGRARHSHRQGRYRYRHGPPPRSGVRDCHGDGGGVSGCLRSTSLRHPSKPVIFVLQRFPLHM